MEQNEREKIKRQATAATIAALASASVMVGGILPDDGALDDGAEDIPTPIVETIRLSNGGGCGGECPADCEDEKKKEKQRLAWFARLPVSVRLLAAVSFGGAMWLACSGICTLLSAAMPPVAASLLGALTAALGLAASFLVFLKALLPEKNLGFVLKKKNLWWLLGGTALLAAADLLLPIVWTGYETLAAFLKLALSAAMLTGAAAAVYRSEKKREQEEREAAEKESERPETMEEARRRVLAMADESAFYDF